MELSFSVDSWSAWSSNLVSRSDWIDWAQGKEVPREEHEPDVSTIPAMKRRRMSRVSRMAIATALDCLGDLEDKPVCVFASRHGELERTVRIINSIISEQDVSPTDFSLSVHNTALGLFSIHTGNTCPATTVVAGENTFAMSLIEASIHLRRFPGKPVLLVYFDEPVTEPLDKLDLGPKQALCVALLLSDSDHSEITVQRDIVRSSEGKSVNKPDELAYEFLRFFLTGEEKRTTKTRAGFWSWYRQK